MSVFVWLIALSSDDVFTLGVAVIPPSICRFCLVVVICSSASYAALNKSSNDIVVTSTAAASSSAASALLRIELARLSRALARSSVSSAAALIYSDRLMSVSSIPFRPISSSAFDIFELSSHTAFCRSLLSIKPSYSADNLRMSPISDSIIALTIFVASSAFF